MLGRNNCQRLRMIACLVVPCIKMKKHKTFLNSPSNNFKDMNNIVKFDQSFFPFIFIFSITGLGLRRGLDVFGLQRWFWNKAVTDRRTGHTLYKHWSTLHCECDNVFVEFSSHTYLFHNYCWNFEFMIRTRTASIYC